MHCFRQFPTRFKFTYYTYWRQFYVQFHVINIIVTYNILILAYNNVCDSARGKEIYDDLSEKTTFDLLKSIKI